MVLWLLTLKKTSTRFANNSIFLIFIDLEMKTSLYKALKAIPVTRLRPQICFFIKAKKQKDSPVSEHSHLWNNLLKIAST